jgi:hypothetical protein
MTKGAKKSAVKGYGSAPVCSLVGQRFATARVFGRGLKRFFELAGMLGRNPLTPSNIRRFCLSSAPVWAVVWKGLRLP